MFSCHFCVRKKNEMSFHGSHVVKYKKTKASGCFRQFFFTADAVDKLLLVGRTERFCPYA